MATEIQEMCIYRGAGIGKDIIIKRVDRTAYLFINDKLYTKDFDKFEKGIHIYDSKGKLKSDISRLTKELNKRSKVPELEYLFHET